MEKRQRAVRLNAADDDYLIQVAAQENEGNVSQLLRRIVAEWAANRHAAEAEQRKAGA